MADNRVARAGQDAEVAPPVGPLDATVEAKKLAYDRVGKGDPIFMISGYPSTRRSWNRLIPLLSPTYECIPTDLPSVGGSGLLNAPATTENVARVSAERCRGVCRCLCAPRTHGRGL
jgi:pimeloyl-ACP methyl ester carboxylesterase